MQISDVVHHNALVPHAKQVERAAPTQPISEVLQDKEPWDETLFVRHFNRFAQQLGQPPLGASPARLNELALVYDRSEVKTLEAFAANWVLSPLT